MEKKVLMPRERVKVGPVALADKDNQSFRTAVLDSRRWAAA